MAKHRDNRKIRYAVVGLGHIAQVAVLPAFKQAANSTLAALVSGNPEKLQKLSRRYRVQHTFSYEQYDDCLGSGVIDAVYIALPNHLHAAYANRAAQAGIHVLCEKPMALTEAECRDMIRTAAEHRVKLMVAYRLHFDEANMRAAEIVRSGKLGTPRFFSSEFSLQVRPHNIRTRRAMGGGTLYDLGIYCINAARYLFRAEPIEVSAFSAAGKKDSRFKEIDEMTGALLRFPEDRLALFVSSFGATDTASYRIVGTRGDLHVDQAYEYAFPMTHRLTVEGRTRTRRFPKRDQFAPELIYFSECVKSGRDPEPSGREGLADIRIIEALQRSAAAGKSVTIEPARAVRRPSVAQVITRPPVVKPPLVRVESASM
jgi:glucose-fructose oxidoreductase